MGSSARQNSETVTTETIGSRLRRERLSKHKTLEDVAEATRINIKTLQAIEGDDKNRLPARVFVQGFIRLYAQYIGIDPQEALAQYSKESDDTIDPKSKINVRSILESESLAESPSFLSSKQILFLILIILLALLIYLGRQNYLTKPEVASVTQSSETLQTEPTAPAGEPAVEPGPEPSAEPAAVMGNKIEQPLPLNETKSVSSKTAAVEKKPTLPSPKEYILEAQFIERTWIWVKVDENEPQEYLFQPGENYKWKAFEKIDINLGNAGGVEFVLNNKKLPQIGVSGQVVRLKMPEATQTLLPRQDAP